MPSIRRWKLRRHNALLAQIDHRINVMVEVVDEFHNIAEELGHIVDEFKLPEEPIIEADFERIQDVVLV